MRTIKMTTGARVPLDGDLLTMLETLYRELTAKRDLERTFADTVREIQSAIEQMTDVERRQYLSESLFLNFVSYENERLGAYLKKLGQAGVSAQKHAKTGASRRKEERPGASSRKQGKAGASPRKQAKTGASPRKQAKTSGAPRIAVRKRAK